MKKQSAGHASFILWVRKTNTFLLASWLACFVGAFSGSAAVLSWSGTSGSTGNWSDSDNWGFAGVPAAGDTLIFSAGQPRLNNTNDIAGLALNQIRFVGAGGGYMIYGQAMTLTNSIQATNTTGGNFISNNITLNTPGDFPVTVGNGATLTLAGRLSGTVGLVKSSPGTLVLSGSLSNNFTGLTTVNAGLVQLSKSGAPPASGIPGSVVVGDGVNVATVFASFSNELGDNGNITVNHNGTYNFNNNSDLVGSNLTLNGNATLSLGSGTLTLNGPGTITAAATFANISGNGAIQLGGGPCIFNITSGFLYVAPSLNNSTGITKSGSGDLYFLGPNSYSGPTIVASGILWASNNLSLGTAASGTVVSNGATLGLFGSTSITNESLILNGGGAPTFASLDSETSTTNIWAGPITLNANATFGVVTPGARFRIIGPISGAGGLTHYYEPGGILSLEGTNINTYAGLTTVNGGILELAVSAPADGAAIPGSLVIGSNSVVRLRRSWQLYQPSKNTNSFVTLNTGSLFDLNGFNDWIGPLNLSAAQVATGAGLLYLNGDITVISNNYSSSVITGNVQLYTSTHTITNTGSAVSPDLYIIANVSSSDTYGFVKAGDGEVSLAGTGNTFTGPVTVNKGALWLQTVSALGGASAVNVNSGGTLFIYGVLPLPGKPLSLNGSGWKGVGALLQSFGTSSWSSNITLAADSVVTVSNAGNLTLNGAISGPGGLTFNGPNTLTFSGSGLNTYAGTTRVNSGILQLGKATFVDGTIPGNLIIGDGIGGPNADVVRLLANNQIENSATVTIASSGVLQENGFYEGIGGLNGSGNAEATGLYFDFYGTNSYQFDGVISGAAAVAISTGNHIWNGPNTMIGPVGLNEGSLKVNGSQPQTPITIALNSTLGGSGTVGAVNAFGSLSPGNTLGTLTTSNVTFSASGKFAVELGGAVNDQINLRGTGILANATLQLSQASAVGLGQQLTIINNDGAEPVSGTFAGLPNGSLITLGGLSFRINYAGGTGNDVVLTVTNIPGAFATAVAFPGNGGLALGPNSCSGVDVVFTNLTGTPMTGVIATLTTTNRGVFVTQPLSPYPNVAAFGRSTNSVRFQISVLPSFVCGNDINLSLNVSSATYGAFTVPFVLAGGGVSPVPNRYDVSTLTNIPDVGAIESTNLVAGFSGQLMKATVSLWLTHPVGSDLDISLISPAGIVVPLTLANGASLNFGSACSPDTSRTTFDDAAAVAITAGSSPFVGTFRPQGSLASLNRTTANGNWRLRVVDNVGGSLGALRCWSLLLSPAVCVDGGGACAMCPIVITNTLTTNSAVQVNRLSRNGIISTCAEPKTTPGVTAATGLHYDAYPFYNGGANTCVTVSFTPACNTMFCVTYLGNYNPTNVSANYLADQGNSVAGEGVYSFNVPSNTLFTVVVSEVSASCDLPYKLSVSGHDCAPLLAATPVGAQQLKVAWPTVAGGYKLEATPSLTATNWAALTNTPIAASNRFSITHSSVTPSNKFYRLRKP